MNSFVDNVEKKLKDKKITKNKLLTDLNLNRNSFVDWKKRGTIPSAKVVSAIAEYLDATIGELLGHTDIEENMDSFNEKLSFQLAVTGKTIKETAQYLGISEDVVLRWLDGSDNSYSDYTDILSSFFDVEPRYWISPGMVSPGIEPTTDEYMLILLYREYHQTGKMNDAYGKLENYFPGIKISYQDTASSRDSDILRMFNSLPYDAQLEFKGELRGYIRRLNHERSGNLREAK